MFLGESLGDFILSGKGSERPKDSGQTVRGQGVRLVILKLATFGAILLLLGVVFQTQVLLGNYYHTLSDGNRLRKEILFAPRGLILDRNGVELTINLPSYTAVLCNSVKNCTRSQISKEQAIELLSKGMPTGGSIEVGTARSYPDAQALAGVLGYVGEASVQDLIDDSGLQSGDLVGRAGIEAEYQKDLVGIDGETLVEVDALGKEIRKIGQRNPVPGKNLELTIDRSLQKAAFAALSGQKGAVIVTQVTTGAVLAMVSSPSFDPNLFTDPTLDGAYKMQKISEVLSDANNPLFNRVISGTYPSGSTFKIVTATAGLETGKITEQTEITDPGILIIGPYKFPNWLYLRNGGTQGTLNVVSAIQKSNDVFFYQVGGLVGVDDLSSWASRFGLGKKLGIDLPAESAGAVPTALWRTEHKPEWYLGDTYHFAIGQGDLLVTPLQVNNWTAVIANGGKMCAPHVLNAISSRCQEIGISQKTLDLVKQGMIGACSPGGTAWPLFNFRIKGGQDSSEQSKTIQIACKTGTAEYGDPSDRTHAWLTAFAPADRPEVAVTVLVEGGGEGSDVAAPVVKKILEAWFSSGLNLTGPAGSTP